MKYHDIDQHIYGVLSFMALLAILTGLMMLFDWLTNGAIVDAFYPPPREQ